jgi:hypothetical protein
MLAMYELFVEHRGEGSYKVASRGGAWGMASPHWAGRRGAARAA